MRADKHISKYDYFKQHSSVAIAVIAGILVLFSMVQIFQWPRPPDLGCKPVSLSEHSIPPWASSRPESSTSSSTSNFEACPTNMAAALEANCTFDPISFSWLPAPCTDTELIIQFLELPRPSSWMWYADQAGTEPLPSDEVLEGRHDGVFVSSEYHVLHCTYMWRKMHRALLNGRSIDSYIGDYSHTEHCEGMIHDYGKAESVYGPESVNTVIWMKWPSCLMQAS